MAATPGRGAWPNNGAGGTLNTAGTLPGRYYTISRPGVRRVGEGATAGGDINAWAVNRAVYHIKRLLTKARYKRADGMPMTQDGVWDTDLDYTMRIYQSRVGVVPDGVFGPKTAQQFFLPTIRAAYAQNGVEWEIGYGLVNLESGWDPGAVGAIDSNDLGLCQINGPAHPDMSVDERLNPETALMWQAAHMRYLEGALKGNERDAIAAYNLGVYGAQQWIAAGRPALWVPPYDTSGRKRDVKGYIDKILAAAENAPTP